MLSSQFNQAGEKNPWDGTGCANQLGKLEHQQIYKKKSTFETYWRVGGEITSEAECLW